MTLEELIITLARTAGSIPVLKWWFVGSIIAIIVDFSDLFMMNLLNLGGVRNYQSLDKLNDLIYMATFLLVSLRWSGIARKVAISLFIYRIVGVVLFEVVETRGILLFFPNVFEFWFLFIAGLRKFIPKYELTWKRTIIWIIPLILLKEFQEYVLHWGKWLDEYRAIDVVTNWWNLATSIL